MSGIVGIINPDGRPIDRELLRRMTGFMAYRGPDAQEMWSEAHVGLGHAMLRTTRESSGERQPLSLDGEVWITADARIDGREDLTGKLESKVAADLASVSDTELILHAYNVWGEGCLDHLIGDFAFAIWDGRNRRLFCARDHFGVKPFYYARAGDSFVFSNTLNCVRLHTAVSDELNDAAVGDFLLFGFNQEAATTTFADIKRLPPAHYLVWSEGVARTIRYWTLPTDGHIRYKRDGEYVEHFNGLFQAAVGDRLRADKIAVSMSGGLDSTSVAATAKKISSEQSRPLDLQAFTMVYDRLIPDQERYYSGLAAEGLGIPIHYLVLDDYKLYERWDCPELRSPEPTDLHLSAFVYDYLTLTSAHSRVLLSGDGGDPVLYYSPSYFAGLMKRFRLLRIFTFMARYARTYRRFPTLGFRTMFKRWVGTYRGWESPYPLWFNRAFADHFNLQARLREIEKEPEPVHPTHPEAYNYLTPVYWPDSFERADPGVTTVPVEYRYPLFDLRLVSFILSIPPLPWCFQKELLRVSMKGMLPETIRLRRKTPLAGDTLAKLIRRPEAEWIDHFDPVPELARYVCKPEIPRIAQENNPGRLWLNTRPLSLNYWLRSYRFVEQTSSLEELHEVAK